jgi:hypothetical protein
MDGINTKEPTTPLEPPNLNLDIMLPWNAKLDPHWHAYVRGWLQHILDIHFVGCSFCCYLVKKYVTIT